MNRMITTMYSICYNEEHNTAVQCLVISLSIADIFPFFYAFGAFYSHLYRNCNSKARGARAIKRLLFFSNSGFKLFSLILHARIINMFTKTWRVCWYFNSAIFNVFSTGKSMKTYTISEVNSRWQQFEVFKKYYKACKLLFKENIPLGCPWPSIKM
jgi:hypothetical protein